MRASFTSVEEDSDNKRESKNAMEYSTRVSMPRKLSAELMRAFESKAAAMTEQGLTNCLYGLAKVKLEIHRIFA